MAMKFENKKLNKDDHAKVDRDAGVARIAVRGIVGLAILGVGAFSKKIFGRKSAEP